MALVRRLAVAQEGAFCGYFTVKQRAQRFPC